MAEAEDAPLKTKEGMCVLCTMVHTSCNLAGEAVKFQLKYRAAAGERGPCGFLILKKGGGVLGLEIKL